MAVKKKKRKKIVINRIFNHIDLDKDREKKNRSRTCEPVRLSALDWQH